MSNSNGSAWWKLLRAGNTLTAVSNIVAGFLLARGAWQPTLPLIFLMLSSVGLYLSGMVLNDVFDLELDRAERPERPLPSGKIDPSLAKLVGWGLMIDGITAAGVAAWLLAVWTPLYIAVALAVAITAYNRIGKHTAGGPFNMGFCRGLNVLLGASAALELSNSPGVFLHAAVIGIFTVGLTLVARNEVTTSDSLAVLRAGRIIQAGIMLLLALPAFVSIPQFGWVLAVTVIWLAARVILYEPYLDPSPQTVQRAVGRLIFLFIPLDALACAAAAGWASAFPVLLLVWPTYVATRRVPMT